MIKINALTVPQFAELRRVSGLFELDPLLIERAIASSLFTLSAEEDGQTVGMTRVVGDGALIALICDVLVRPDFRGRGIGAALIHAALECAVSNMPPGLWLTVAVIHAPERYGFYKRLGFEAGKDGVMRTFVRR
ncbi:hypothetical protein FACS1894217_14080 [Clostridia bacterium]|nr:hypothetical protein FACS1894217_14080 [Clostridia bacterium]